MTEWLGKHWTDATLQRVLDDGHEVMDIGQISPKQKARLRRLAKAGELVHCRTYFCGIGHLRSTWQRLAT